MDAEALNEKLEERRKDPRADDRSPRPESLSIEVEEVDARCSRCREEFTYQRVMRGGRPVADAPTMCDSCVPQANAERESAETDARARADRISRMPEILTGLGVARRHLDCTLEKVHEGRGGGYNVEIGSMSALTAAMDFARDTIKAGKYGTVRGLGLVGTTGLGKTHLVVGILRRVLEEPSISPSEVVYDHAGDLITLIQDTYGTGETTRQIERRVKARLWVLDEFGSEKGTKDALRIVHSILNRREGAPTVFAGNHHLAELSQTWGDDPNWKRILSRLDRLNFRIGTLEGVDQRTIGEAA